MNIIKRIANWIIKKLGGTTKEICEMWEKSADYWYHQYLAEHENYLAMLNLYNTTVKQKQKPVEAAKTIKAHCKVQNYCENCELGDESGVCKVANSVPCYWDFRQVMFGEVIDE